LASPQRSQSPAHQATALRETLRLATDLAEALATQAARVKRQCQQLEQALDELPALPDAAVALDPGASAPAVTPGPSEDPARLAAMEMALQGASREQIDAYLRNNLRVGDTRELLDEVFSGRQK